MDCQFCGNSTEKNQSLQDVGVIRENWYKSCIELSECTPDGIRKPRNLLDTYAWHTIIINCKTPDVVSGLSVSVGNNELIRYNHNRMLVYRELCFVTTYAASATTAAAANAY